MDDSSIAQVRESIPIIVIAFQPKQQDALAQFVALKVELEKRLLNIAGVLERELSCGT